MLVALFGSKKLQRLGPDELYAVLQQRDPASASLFIHIT